jgi:hypothetical protein
MIITVIVGDEGKETTRTLRCAGQVGFFVYFFFCGCARFGDDAG